MENSERALELFGERKSVNAVAKILGITWAEAKKLQPAIVDDKPAKPRKTKKTLPKKEPEPVENRWELGIRVPLERAVSIFADFSQEEKVHIFSELPAQRQMDSIARILQRRMDAICAPPAPPEEAS